MIEKTHQFFELFIYALAAVTGGLGGCASACFLQSKSKTMLRWSFVAAYLIIGAAMGVLVVAFSYSFGSKLDLHDVIFRSCIAGITSPVTLLFIHSYTRWRLRKNGKRYTIVIEPLDEDGGQ